MKDSEEEKGTEEKRKDAAQEEEPRKKRRKGLVLIIIGISLIILGLFTLAGVYGYIWYTDNRAEQAQDELFQEWEEEPVASETGEVVVGEGITRIVVPRLGLDAIVVELWGLDDAENLKRGPGHIPTTAYPGQPGNVVISGHRTTYGAPFKHIEEIQTGDEIILITADNQYTYEADEQRIVMPTDLTVLEQGDEAKITLTACHPWYSAAQRIVIIGSLVSAEPL
jgi:sortase A